MKTIKTFYPELWYIRVGNFSFVGLDKDVTNERRAIAFPSERSAKIFIEDAYGNDSFLLSGIISNKSPEFADNRKKYHELRREITLQAHSLRT